MVAGAAAPDPMVGRRLGRYDLEYLVAHGGMASVYLAQLASSHLQRWVAVKVMHAHLATDGHFVDMFMDEARLAAQIQHANVCPVIDFGEHEGSYYIVMEYLHGETLSSLVKHAWRELGELPPGLVARILSDIARGLHAAHELRGPNRQPLGVVHRDVSPQNMMVLYDGVSKITDFGVARAEGRLATTRSGTVKGKFSYMSPEQLNGGAVDRRSDVWSLGVVLWEASLGQRLFRGRSDGETAVSVVTGPILSPREVDPDYPAELESIVMGALERDPSARIGTAGELSRRLDDFARKQEPHFGTSEVSAFVQGLFIERRRQREDMLTWEAPTTVIPEADLASQSTLGSHVVTRKLTPEEPARPRWLLPVGIAAALLAVSGGWAFMSWLTDDDSEQVASTLPLEHEGTGAPAVSRTPAAPTGASAARAPKPALTAPIAAPVIEAPVIEAPVIEAPVIEAPVIEAPAIEAPAIEAPVIRAPVIERRAPAVAVRAPREAQAPRRARPPRPTPAPVGEGTLNLLAIPRAEVLWRGRSIGTTPLVNRTFPAGRQRLVIRAVDGSGERTVTVDIRAGERTSQSINLGH